MDFVSNKEVEDVKFATKSCLINTNTIDTKNFPIIFTSHHGTASEDYHIFFIH